MALTPTEEALVRQLLDQQAAILSLAGNEATITSKLGATKVTLSDLLAASSVGDTDLFLTRQGTTDKSVTGQVLRGTLNKFSQPGIGAVERTVQQRLLDTINVTDYGAIGNGIADDTSAFNAAATALQNGQSLYIPSGDYIIDSGCVLFRGKSNIDIYGDGKSTRIHPSNQGPTGVKQDFHTTFAIDECSFVSVRDMCIESKGENYGNTDAYGGLAGGDPRTNAIINFGGSAVLVSRSDHVTLHNIDGRYCGSVGVFYLSSCEEIVVQDCFANARSLGYAGFAVDNWAHSTIKTKRTYKFIDCRVSKEDATYAAKGGIVTEGDEVTQRLLNVEVVGGVFEDCIIGGDYPIAGAAVTAMETRLMMTGVTTKNCLFGVSWTKRGGAVDYSWLNVTGCQFLGNKVSGAYINISTGTGGSDVSITGTKIVTNPTSHWAAVGTVTNLSVKESSGITVGGYQSGQINVSGCDISGAQHGAYAIDSAPYIITGSRIACLESGVKMYGGGTLRANGNNISTTGASSFPVYMTTANKAATASYDARMDVCGNVLTAAGDATTDLAVFLGGNSALFDKIRVKGNVVTDGVISVAKGSAAVFDRDEVCFNTTQRVLNYGLSGADTFIEVRIPKEHLPAYAYAVGTDGVARAVTGQTNNYGGSRGLVRLVLAGDVRTHFIATNNVRATLMQ